MNAPSKAHQTLEASPTLTERLRSLGVQLGVGDLTPAAAASRQTQQGIDCAMPGQVLDTPHGPCFVVETRCPLDHAHGELRLSALDPDTHPSPLLSCLAGDRRLVQMDYGSAIFFDIETSGLGIGAGVYAFMVGFGTFEGDEFCVRQYFMRDYGEEDALLYLLAQQMQERRWWISFNGRNFDLPILQSRFTCGRLRMPLPEAPHLDLLYPARRLWRRRLRSCSLSSLESGALQVPRGADVPGWLVPQIYFDYLRYGDTTYMPQVFYHNAHDVLSLVTLTARVERLLSNAEGTGEHATDLYSLSMIQAAQGQYAKAERSCERAIAQGLPAELQDEAQHSLARLCKRNGRMEHSVQIWQELGARGSASACVQLAKYYEHHERDPRVAAAWVCQALAMEDLAGAGECSQAALCARLARLRRKTGKGGLPMPHITSYAFGKIVVDDRPYSSDLILLPGGARPNWRRKQGHSLLPDDLQLVIEAKPAVLVIGTGNVGLMQIPQPTLDSLAAQGVRVEVYRTAEACQRYNELAEHELAAAALHLTC